MFVACMAAVLAVSAGALPPPRVPRPIKTNFVRSDAYGGAPMVFKNSKDYVRKQSNDPYRRKLIFVPLDVTKNEDNKNLHRNKPRQNSKLASLFDKNRMFYLTAPKKRYQLGRDTKSLLQKKLDQDYASLELRGKKKRTGQLSFEKRPKVAFNSEFPAELAQSHSNNQPIGKKFVKIGPKTSQLVGNEILNEQRTVDEDADYNQEVLAILRDVQSRGAALQRKDLDAKTEYQFEDLVS